MTTQTPLPLARASRRLRRLSQPIPAKSVPSAYYLAHRERIIAQSRAWYQAHRELVLARLAASYAKSPGKYQRRIRLTQARRRAKLSA